MKPSIQYLDEYTDRLHPIVAWLFWLFVLAACVTIRKVLILLGVGQ